MESIVIPFKFRFFGMNFLFTILEIINFLYVAVSKLHILDAKFIDGFVAIFVITENLSLIDITLADLSFHLLDFGLII
jgi:hypothetical protein